MSKNTISTDSASEDVSVRADLALSTTSGADANGVATNVITARVSPGREPVKRYQYHFPYYLGNRRQLQRRQHRVYRHHQYSGDMLGAGDQHPDGRGDGAGHLLCGWGDLQRLGHDGIW